MGWKFPGLEMSSIGFFSSGITLAYFQDSSTEAEDRDRLVSSRHLGSRQSWNFRKRSGLRGSSRDPDFILLNRTKRASEEIGGEREKGWRRMT